MKIYLLKRINAKIEKLLFVIFALFKSRLLNKRKLKILFSKHAGWENNIRNGFRYTQHYIAFEELSSANIQDYDLVVPLFIRDLMYLNEADHQLKNNPIPIPSKESIILCDDKRLFNQKMLTGGFADFTPRIDGKLTYPYILKKSIDDSSKHTYIISNHDQEQTFKDLISSPEYFCQVIIPGSREYATHILFKNHEIINSINIEYVFAKDLPIKGQDKEIYTRMIHCPFLEVFSSILTMLNFEGLCCINYKVLDNLPLIFEINPRFGGSLSPFFFSLLDYLS